MSLQASPVSGVNSSMRVQLSQEEFKYDNSSHGPDVFVSPLTPIGGQGRDFLASFASVKSRPLESYTLGAIPVEIKIDVEPVASSAVKATSIPSNIEEISENALKELNKITTILGTLETIYNLMKGDGSVKSGSALAQSIDKFITEAKETTDAIKGLQAKIKSGDTAGLVAQYTTLLKEIQETKAAGGALIESLKKAGEDAKQAIQETVGFFKSLFSCCFTSSSK